MMGWKVLILDQDPSDDDPVMTRKTPFLDGVIKLVRALRQIADQAGTGCSMMPVGTSANKTEDR